MSGYFDDRNDVWRQPVDRNVFGLLEQFGDAEVASLIAPRTLIVEAAKGPEVIIPPGTGGAPGRLTTPKLEKVRHEIERARRLVHELKPSTHDRTGDSGPDGSRRIRYREGPARTRQGDDARRESSLHQSGRPFRSNGLRSVDSKARQDRQLHELDRHNQQLLVESPYVRREFMKKLDTSSIPAYTSSIEPYRTYLRGRGDRPVRPRADASRCPLAPGL